jgi:hypothetical protein
MIGTDVGVRGDYWVTSNFGLSATGAAQILFAPHKLFQHSAANAPGAASGTGDRP